MQFIAVRFDRLSAQEHYGIIQQTCPSPLIPRSSFGANAAPADSPPGASAKSDRGLRERLHTIIFEADTRTARIFDLMLIATILHD
jgi:hypothetical protein